MEAIGLGLAVPGVVDLCLKYCPSPLLFTTRATPAYPIAQVWQGAHGLVLIVQACTYGNLGISVETRTSVCSSQGAAEQHHSN